MQAFHVAGFWIHAFVMNAMHGDCIAYKKEKYQKYLNMRIKYR